MKSEMNRWTDEENFFGSEHVSSQIWCYLKLVRWRDESEMKRWTDEEKFFGSEHVSSQIWCYLKLVRWRDEEWDEQMNRWRKFFWVQTCIKSNLVLSEISEMKRWRVRWRDGKNFFEMKKIFFLSEHVSSQIWCYLKLVRWRDEEWDEEMGKKFLRWKKNFFRSEHVSSQICCQKFFPLPKKLHPDRQTDRQTYGHHSDQISRSARETERLKMRKSLGLGGRLVRILSYPPIR